MSLSYGWEKFHVAVLCLASGRGSIQDRLANAFVSALIRLEPKEDLPPELQTEFSSIVEEMTKVGPTGDEGSIMATANIMPAERASAIAEKIVEMYDTITRQDELDSHIDGSSGHRLHHDGV